MVTKSVMTNMDPEEPETYILYAVDGYIIVLEYLDPQRKILSSIEIKREESAFEEKVSQKELLDLKKMIVKEWLNNPELVKAEI